jgi:protein involved in polysaccharide export with SLBB domain
MKPRLTIALIAAFLAALGLSAGAQDQPAPPEDNISVIIKGQVLKPGTYTISSDFTVIDAIDMAGGFTPQALRTQVTVTRATKMAGEDPTVTLDYSENSLTTVNFTFKLRPGDVIFIPADPPYGK